jgi:hypothetical protein
MVVTGSILQPGFADRYPLLAIELGARRLELAAGGEAPVHRGLPELGKECYGTHCASDAHLHGIAGTSVIWLGIAPQ